MALGFGEPLDLGEDEADASCFVEGAVGGKALRGEGLGEGFVELAGTDAAATVDGEVPCDAREPDAEIADGGQGVVMFEDADEDVLDDIFGFGGAAQDGVGDAEEQFGVCLNEGGEVDLPRALGGRYWQAIFLDQRHKSLLLRKDARRAVPLGIILMVIRFQGESD